MTEQSTQQPQVFVVPEGITHRVTARSETNGRVVTATMFLKHGQIVDVKVAPTND